MCGLVGVLSVSDGAHSSLNEIIDLLKHRGPDDQGTYYDKKISLGHTRLSILDLSPLGHQPMSYAGERYWIVFNGEIYNYLELRDVLQAKGHQFRSQTDTEIILAAYAEWGVACLDKLRGMFAFALWDKKQKNLFLARDRTGEKPLYYWHDDKKFYFASELKTLIRLLPEKPALDPASIDLYFHYQYVPEPRTPFVDVWKLQAAHYLLIDSDNWRVNPKPYWSFNQIEPIQGDPIEIIRTKLERSIKLTLRSDVPVGIALSGGLDSSAIAALAVSGNDSLQAFSIGYPGRPAYDERQQAEELAKQLGLPFHDIELHTDDLVKFFPSLVSIMDDPIADIAAYGHYSVNKLAADHGVKVMLSGLGGDELFWGYPHVVDAVQRTDRKKTIIENSWSKFFYSQMESFWDKFPSRSISKRLESIKSLMLNHPDRAVYYNIRPNFQEALRHREHLYDVSSIPIGNIYLPFNINQDLEQTSLQISKICFDTWLTSNCLALADRVSMASSVETRVPFLETELLNTVIGLRKNSDDVAKGHKYWLKQALSCSLSKEILKRPKRGFEPPVIEWYQGILAKYLGEVKNSVLITSGFMSKAYFEKLVHEYRSNNQHIFMLYKITLFSIWARSLGY